MANLLPRRRQASPAISGFACRTAKAVAPFDKMIDSSQQIQEPFSLERLTQIYLRGYETDEAKKRAQNVANDVRKIGIMPTLNFLPIQDRLQVPFYTFGQSNFTLDNLDKKVPDTLKAVGFGLNWGDLFLLSHVCEFGRNIWGEDWVLKFHDQLKHFPDHIATVEELWWLSLWHSPSEIEHEFHLGRDTKHTIDWRFKTCSQILNLEVKLRPKDWIRTVDGRMYSAFRKSIFEDCGEKFCRNNDDELNFVGVTLLGPLDQETTQAAESFLAENDKIDGVIYWSTGIADQAPEKFHLKPRAKHAKLLFRKPEHYDYRSTLIIHPWMDSERRRAEWLGIVEDFSKIDGLQQKVGRILVPNAICL
jgi:hypothetical protein